VFDTTQATSTDRLQIWVNGVRQTAGGVTSYPSQNASFPFLNSAQVFYIGGRASDGFFDGYMTEVQFIDGQALTPNSFGTFNSFGVWQPITYGGSYGTNGFYLPFTNNASTTTLGLDFSPQGNNWTTNNISLTAGSTYDSMTDVPTLTSTTAANYVVLNPLVPTSTTYSNGNLSATLPSSGNANAYATVFVNSDKYYWETTFVSFSGSTAFSIGILNSYAINLYGTSSVSYYSDSGSKNINGTFSSYGAPFTSGDVIGTALDLTNNQITFYKNGTSQGVISITSGISWTPAFTNGTGSGNQVFNVNFGQQPFAYTAPSGFLPLNTFNL
jgi:hypothetical protein